MSLASASLISPTSSSLKVRRPSLSGTHGWIRHGLKGSENGHLALCSSFSPGNKRFARIAFSRSNCIPSVVTSSTWEDHILKSELPVLVVFWTSWCGPCRAVHPLINEIAEEYDGKIKCFKLNADDDFEVTIKYGVKSVPTVLLFRDGNKLESITGTMPKYIYANAVKRTLAH